jgi:hypothetical protein
MARERCPRATVLAAAVVLALLTACSRGPGRAAVAPSPYPTDDASLLRPLPSPLPDVIARVNGEPIRVEQVLPMAKKDLDERPAEEIAKRKPLALRRALLKYVDRELLVQEALARGVTADTRRVDWAYDQLRREHPDDAEWAAFLLKQGLDPQRFRTELRVQQTVAALVDDELDKTPVTDAEARTAYDRNPTLFSPVGPNGPAPFESVKDAVVAAVRETRRPATIEALLARLHATGRIEIFI